MSLETYNIYPLVWFLFTQKKIQVYQNASLQKNVLSAYWSGVPCVLNYVVAAVYVTEIIS